MLTLILITDMHTISKLDASFVDNSKDKTEDPSRYVVSPISSVPVGTTYSPESKEHHELNSLQIFLKCLYHSGDLYGFGKSPKS